MSEISQNNLKIDFCSRCKVKTAEVKCDSCTIFNSFCQQCDASVHSLPLKKSHKRNFYSVFQKTQNSNIGILDE